MSREGGLNLSSRPDKEKVDEGVEEDQGDGEGSGLLSPASSAASAASVSIQSSTSQGSGHPQQVVEAPPAPNWKIASPGGTYYNPVYSSTLNSSESETSMHVVVQGEDRSPEEDLDAVISDLIDKIQATTQGIVQANKDLDAANETNVQLFKRYKALIDAKSLPAKEEFLGV